MAFDIDRYTETSVSVNWSDLDLEVFRREPLPETSLRTLRYMADVEYHTVCYTRDLLTTPSHREADVSAFMTMWNREEFWHGEALAAVLAMHDITVDYDQLKASRLKLGWKDRLDPIKQSVLGGLVGQDFVAVHMSWGAANEWSAITAYQFWAPVGSSIMQPDDVRHVMGHLMSGPEGRRAARKVDDSISGMPGLAGLTIVQDALDRLGVAA